MRFRSGVGDDDGLTEVLIGGELVNGELSEVGAGNLLAVIAGRDDPDGAGRGVLREQRWTGDDESR